MEYYAEMVDGGIEMPTDLAEGHVRLVRSRNGSRLAVLYWSDWLREQNTSPGRFAYLHRETVGDADIRKGRLYFTGPVEGYSDQEIFLVARNNGALTIRPATEPEKTNYGSCFVGSLIQG